MLFTSGFSLIKMHFKVISLNALSQKYASTNVIKNFKSLPTATDL